MAGKIEAKLAELGVTVPGVATPAGNYVPWTVSGNLVFIAGQITLIEGKPHYLGKLGKELSVEDGQQAAKLCALNILAQLRQACGGDLDRVRRCLRLGGFVACTPDFTDHAKVINGASDFIVAVLGDAGRHARAAVGCASLPLGVAVEVEGIFEIG